MNKLEQAARQALEALEVSTDWDVGAKGKQLQSMKAITSLREALAEQATEPVGRCKWCLAYNGHLDFCPALAEQAEQPVSQEYQDHLVNQSFDWAAMAAKHQFMEGYRIGLAEMREKCAKVVTEHAPTCSPHWVSYVVAIRAIKFEGDTGFRPVSEMIAEHKQDPKKAAAIEYHPLPHEDIISKEPLYTAPARTKDLTDDEIADVFRAIHMKESWSLVFARAVIAAYKEKNK